MDVLAALGDALTAVIAIVAIVLGVVLAARGQRGQRAAEHGAADEMRPSLKVPIAAAAPATDADGLRKMASGEVGHGAIRLGMPAWRAAPAPGVEPPPQVQPKAPEPEPEAEPEPVEEPPAPEPHDSPSSSEPGASHDPQLSSELAAPPDLPPPHEPAAQNDPPHEPAAQNDPPPGAVPFRQGIVESRQPPTIEPGHEHRRSLRPRPQKHRAPAVRALGMLRSGRLLL